MGGFELLMNLQGMLRDGPELGLRTAIGKNRTESCWFDFMYRPRWVCRATCRGTHQLSFIIARHL